MIVSFKKILKTEGYIFLSFFVFAILINSVGIVLLKAQKIYGIDPLTVSNIELYKEIPITILSFFAVYAICKLGHWITMIFSLGLISFALFGLYIGNSFSWLLFLFVATGISFVLVKISIYTLVGRITSSKKQHARLLMLLEAIFMFGIAVMYFVFPLFNSNKKESSWLDSFLVIGILTTIMFVMLLFKRKAFTLRECHIDFGTDGKKVFRMMLKPVVVVFLISSFFFVSIEQGIMTWLPSFHDMGIKLDENVAIMASSVFTLLIALGRYFNTFLLRFFNPFYILFVAIIATELLIYYGLPITLQTDVSNVHSFGNIPLRFFAFSLVGFFIAPIYPLLNSIVLSATPKIYHSPMTGMILVSSALGGVFGARFMGFLTKDAGVLHAFEQMIIPVTLLLISILLLSKLIRNEKDYS